MRHERAFQSRVAGTTAEVLHVDYERPEPVVQLRLVTRDGRTIEAATKEFEPPDGYYGLLTEGDSLEVIYQLEDPARVRGVDWSEQYWDAWSLGLLGGFILLVTWGPFGYDAMEHTLTSVRGSRVEPQTASTE